jgi:hypothetical protein
MKFEKIGKVFKRYRIEYYRKKLLKNPSYFIHQFSDLPSQHKLCKDMKEIFFYPIVFNSSTDININKLIMILSSENIFLCSAETVSDNKKVIEYQVKLKNISDCFYRDCYAKAMQYEIDANGAYAEINSLLAAAKSANNKRFKISPFFNFWHSSLLKDNWQFFECLLETDDFIVLKYKLQMKKYKNYCFDPSLLFGATKEHLQIRLEADDNFYYCSLKIGLLLDVSRINVSSVN